MAEPFSVLEPKMRAHAVMSPDGVTAAALREIDRLRAEVKRLGEAESEQLLERARVDAGRAARAEARVAELELESARLTRSLGIVGELPARVFLLERVAGLTPIPCIVCGKPVLAELVDVGDETKGFRPIIKRRERHDDCPLPSEVVT